MDLKKSFLSIFKLISKTSFNPHFKYEIFEKKYWRLLWAKKISSVIAAYSYFVLFFVFVIDDIFNQSDTNQTLIFF